MTGTIEAITGSMFAGKTDELIRRLMRMLIAKQKFRLFRPNVDTRDKGSNAVSHSGREIEAEVIDSSLPPELRAQIKTDLKKDGIRVVAFDEAQFFSLEIIDFSRELAYELNLRVIIAGLDMDSTGKPFGPMPFVLAIAETITKLKAICESCGKEASFTLWRGAEKEQIAIGGLQEYGAVCGSCWFHHNNPKTLSSL